MKIGYPCINWTIGCKGDRSFRLKSYSENRLVKTVENNLTCLLKILRFNVKEKILFFRITSDLVPFASHPICQFNWQEHFRTRFGRIGDFVKDHHIRISMHPDQFTLINSRSMEVFKASLRELVYHAQILDLMEVDSTAKIQIHVGGIYGDKEESVKRFVHRYERMDEEPKRRLVIENDDRLYNLQDCLRISEETGIPVLFDYYHHQAHNSGGNVSDAFELFTKTWKEKDGLPMVDYSSQEAGARKPRHAETIDLVDFGNFLAETSPFDCDVMLEIKDKEESAQKAVGIALHDSRFFVPV